MGIEEFVYSSVNVREMLRSPFKGRSCDTRRNTHVDKDLAEFTKYLLTIGLVVDDKDMIEADGVGV